MNISTDLFTKTYVKTNQLNMIGLIDQKKTKEKKYAVTCDICSIDKELFDQPYFQISKSSILNGALPCGCSDSPKWNENQMRVRVSRALLKKNINYFYFLHPYAGNKTIVIAKCETHGWYRTNIDKILIGYSCRKCAAMAAGMKSSKTDKDIETELNESGIDVYDVKRLDRVSSAGDRRYFEYKCRKCSNDEMVSSGLCSGVFVASICDIRRCRKSCRCNKTYKYNKDQIEFLYKKHEITYKTGYKFIGVTESNSGYPEKIKRLCKEHGEFETKLNHVKLYNTGCPSCAGNNQKQAYINIIKDGENELFAKFGIANNYKNRVYSQNLRSTFTVENLSVWSFKSVNSCKKAEKECKRILKTGLIKKEDMADGFTETFSILDIDRVISIYERFGGVRA